MGTLNHPPDTFIMQKLMPVLSGLLAGALVLGGTAQASPGATQQQHMDHSAMTHGDHGSTEASAAGRPGDPTRATRTIEVTALGTMRFEPEIIQAKAGETVRIVVTNAGKLEHELTIGDRSTQLEHEKMMREMPGMEHEDPGSVTLAPGETKTLVWEFGAPRIVEFACHVPGHYPAGMVSIVEVTSQ